MRSPTTPEPRRHRDNERREIHRGQCAGQHGVQPMDAVSRLSPIHGGHQECDPVERRSIGVGRRNRRRAPSMGGEDPRADPRSKDCLGGDRGRHQCRRGEFRRLGWRPDFGAALVGVRAGRAGGERSGTSSMWLPVRRRAISTGSRPLSRPRAMRPGPGGGPWPRAAASVLRESTTPTRVVGIADEQACRGRPLRARRPRLPASLRSPPFGEVPAAMTTNRSRCGRASTWGSGGSADRHRARRTIARTGVTPPVEPTAQTPISRQNRDLGSPRTDSGGR